jgi:hypothetical protein
LIDQKCIVPLDGHIDIFAGKDLNGVLFCTSIADDKCTCGSTRVCTHMQAARILSNLSQRNATENEKNGLTEKEIELTQMKTRLFSSALMPVTENREVEEMEQVNFQFKIS